MLHQNRWENQNIKGQVIQVIKRCHPSCLENTFSVMQKNILMDVSVKNATYKLESTKKFINTLLNEMIPMHLHTGWWFQRVNWRSWVQSGRSKYQNATRCIACMQFNWKFVIHMSDTDVLIIAINISTEIPTETTCLIALALKVVPGSYSQKK